MNPTHDWHVGTDGMELMVVRAEQDSVAVFLGPEANDPLDRESTQIITSRLLEMIDTVQPGAVRAYLAEQEPPDAVVEGVARALYAEDANASVSPDPWPAWGSDDNAARSIYRANARAALKAQCVPCGKVDDHPDHQETPR